MVLSAVLLLCLADICTAQSTVAQQQATETSAFDHFVRDGGMITYFILLPLSGLTIGLCVDHFLHICRGTLLPDQLKITLGELIEQRKYKEVLEVTARDPSLLAAVLHSGLSQANSGRPVARAGCGANAKLEHADHSARYTPSAEISVGRSAKEPAPWQAPRAEP